MPAFLAASSMPAASVAQLHCREGKETTESFDMAEDLELRTGPPMAALTTQLKDHKAMWTESPLQECGTAIPFHSQALKPGPNGRAHRITGDAKSRLARARYLFI